jgi:hypothetical protein
MASRRFFSLFILFCCITARSQDTSTGAIHGTVGDSAGARIGGASVVLVNGATNFRYSTTTDATGRFAFELLPPGDYSTRAESPGMSPRTTPSLHVDIGGTTELVFKLAATNCQLPSGLAQLEQADVSAFSHNFKTPKLQQASLNVEREVAHRLAVGVSYMYVHGVDLIRARDENLPPPVNVAYPVYDATGTKFQRRVLRRGIVLHVAADTDAHLPVSSLHQSAGTAYSTTGVDQCFRERGIECLSRRHALHSPPHDQRGLLHALVHFCARHR